jgi:hypothetical protein
VESNPKRYAAMFPGWGSFRPFSKESPATQATIHESTGVFENPGLASQRVTNSGRFRTSVVFQSAAMKELMDELSYLGDMIQAGT